jgi:hypothetical protein
MSRRQDDGWQPLSINRRLVNDLLYFSRGIPLFPMEREFDLAALSQLRDQAKLRIAWPLLFVKAYGLLAAARPELRQSYQPWPWPHLYQHPQSVAMLAVSRNTPSGERLCWARFTAPEQQSLAALQADLERYKTAPVDEVFRRQVRLSRLPTPLRRLAWWLSLHTSGSRRGKRLGTFGLSTVAGSGAINRFHPSCLTTSLSYGPLSAAGKTLVTVVCDHRVVDGAPMARALQELEEIFAGPIADELAGVSRCAQAA